MKNKGTFVPFVLVRVVWLHNGKWNGYAVP